MTLLYVHLFADEVTANTVGSRHGQFVVFNVHAKVMADECLVGT
jgi:RNA:NAD 2'-phosphotransferase (TPT1/KptA family)